MALGSAPAEILSFLANAAQVASFIQQYRTGSDQSSRVRSEQQFGILNQLHKEGRLPSLGISQESDKLNEVQEYISNLTISDRKKFVATTKKLMIDKELLEAFLEKVAECKQRHIDSVRQASGYEDRQAEHRRAQACVCDILREIKQFNSGNLPIIHLSRLWDSYNCRG